jgi:hypothetical protein
MLAICAISRDAIPEFHACRLCFRQGLKREAESLATIEGATSKNPKRAVACFSTSARGLEASDFRIAEERLGKCLHPSGATTQFSQERASLGVCSDDSRRLASTPLHPRGEASEKIQQPPQILKGSALPAEVNQKSGRHHFTTSQGTPNKGWAKSYQR